MRTALNDNAKKETMIISIIIFMGGAMAVFRGPILLVKVPGALLNLP